MKYGSISTTSGESAKFRNLRNMYNNEHVPPQIFPTLQTLLEIPEILQEEVLHRNKVFSNLNSSIIGAPPAGTLIS